MGNNICYHQDLYRNEKKRNKTKGSRDLDSSCPKINVNYNIKYSYNNYIQNNSVHHNNNNTVQQPNLQQPNFEQVNKLLVLEENMMKDQCVQGDQLQYLMLEYQYMIEELDKQNNPIKNYFIQKLQNMMSQGAIRKAEGQANQTNQTLLEIENSQASFMNQTDQKIDNGQISFLGQIEKKLENKQMKRIQQRRISQNEQARKKSLYFTLKLAEQTPQKDDKQQILEIIEKYEQNNDRIQDELQRQHEDQMDRFKYRLFNRNIKKVKI